MFINVSVESLFRIPMEGSFACIKVDLHTQVFKMSRKGVADLQRWAQRPSEGFTELRQIARVPSPAFTRGIGADIEAEVGKFFSYHEVFSQR